MRSIKYKKKFIFKRVSSKQSGAELTSLYNI